ncbi:pantoate--beta-alanine ligase [Alteromonas sp. H39]|uniref:pantoate--beta-alanine ligase n=1 Tax=Alteromonas sp. H39 TaxID=3389876 RepID=UPI0039E1EF57
MKNLTTIADLRDLRKGWRQAGKSVGFVPTMGNLHNGHLQLVREAKKHCDVVVVSIFVNPMQFGANEDLDAYPRTLEADQQKLMSLAVDALFLPTADIMYPKGLDQQTFVEVPGISDVVCGASRPGHFRGVATVVTKLFNMVQPEHAFFGEKDYQQLQVIKALVEDLSMDIQIHGVPTEREASGLAMSSRNGYLSDEQRQTASTLNALMLSLRNDILQGERDYTALEAKYSTSLNDAGFTTDYVSVRHARTLQNATADDQDLVILIAAYLGKTRLIDNIQVHLS